jgi:hypothetical protein
MAIEDVDRKTATAGVELGMDIYKSGMSQEQFEQRMSLEDRQLRQQGQLAREQIAAQKDIAAMRPESLDFRESFAKRLFEEYKQRNTAGQLYVNGKRLPPNSKTDAELYTLAMQEVVNRMPTAQQAGGFDPSTGLPTSSGGSPSAGSGIDFTSLK